MRAEVKPGASSSVARQTALFFLPQVVVVGWDGQGRQHLSLKADRFY